MYIGYPPEEIRPEDAFAPRPLPSRPEDAEELRAIHSGTQVLYAEIPYGEYGCFLLWVTNEAGEAAGVVNRPEIWSQSLDSAMPDDRFTVYGQNFFGFDQRYFVDTTCVLKSMADGRCYTMRWGACQDLQQYMPGQNDHKSDYRLPADIPAGEYWYAMTNGTRGGLGLVGAPPADHCVQTAADRAMPPALERGMPPEYGPEHGGRGHRENPGRLRRRVHRRHPAFAGGR